ncbi:MAG: hypothetical protein R3266_07055 [Gemmatimonadota bacterium]|nr:hypothetical protein [Gemmatimonadota bacterium]
MSNCMWALSRGRPGVHLVPLLTLMAAGLGVGPGALSAQEESIDSPFRWRERGFRIGLFGGYHAANRGSLEFGQGPSPAGGVKMRVRASSPLSLELGLTHAPAERWVVDAAAEGGPAIVDTVAAGWLRAEGGVQVALTGARTWNGIQPYGLFGGGFVFGVDEGASELLADPALEAFRYDISTAPHIYLGLGFEIFPSGKIGIGFEVRDYVIRLSAPDGFLLPDILEGIEEAGAPAPDASAWQHNPEFGIVLWYYF